MFNFFFNRPSDLNSSQPQNEEMSLSITFRDEEILLPALTEQDLLTYRGRARALAAYLLQLEQEGCLTPAGDSLTLPWEQYFMLQQDPDHADSLALLDLPPPLHLTPMLASEGSLSDPAFKVFLRHWRTPDGDIISGTLARTGAIFTHEGVRHTMDAPAWALLQAIKAFARQQHASPGQTTNEQGWAAVRKAAKAAGAVSDGFLERTIVVRPESLRLKLQKSDERGLHVIEVIPHFEDQPEGWLASFDRLQNVPDHYGIASPDGGITHVLIAPEVKTVLQEIRAFPARRVAGDKALQLLRNPYACLGQDANKVLSEEQFEQDREDAGFCFLRFSLQPAFTQQDRLSAVHLHLDALSDPAMPPVILPFQSPGEFKRFVEELRLKRTLGLPCGFWEGYELELSDFTQEQFQGIEALLQRWEHEAFGALFDGVFDLSQYGSRVIGFGAAPTYTSPFLTQTSGQQWLPQEVLNALGLDGELLSKWDTDNVALLREFEENIRVAVDEGHRTVVIPGLDATVPLKTGQAVALAWANKLQPPPEGNGNAAPKPAKTVILIDGNVDALDYVEQRTAQLQLPEQAAPDLPRSLLPGVTLREHQRVGVAWLQHLFECAPGLVSGCLLADDMGLGKTLQLLTFIASYLERTDRPAPVLIVAPVSLLDNWESELKRFFAPEFSSVLKLYGNTLAAARFPKHEIPSVIQARGVFNLLRPDWRDDKRIVLTTYETLRDQEFSLARQQWSIVVCDEAQKIKNPAALVTQAAKAVPARFKIACTGTPVENSLTDLWCLFDFIQPGFLGSLNEFGKKYRPPAEAHSSDDQKDLDVLRALIAPQILRRMKADVAKDLPEKIESVACKQLPMGHDQLALYKSEVDAFQSRNTLLDKIGGNNMAILGLLHTMKLICAHPSLISRASEREPASPKMHWLLQQLAEIKKKDEKVIVFTELRDIQTALRLEILDRFGLQVKVINGDTKASGHGGSSRQGLIDEFQAKPGFGVIILSTTAVGFGVNVQAANHVIHFTRCWNPAKEDQATDRAYRIGQTRDVHVYYPTVVTGELETFEQKLDALLTRKRTLANDMLNGSGDVDFMQLMDSEPK